MTVATKQARTPKTALPVVPDLDTVLAALLEQQDRVEISLRACAVPAERSRLMEHHRQLTAFAGTLNELRNVRPVLQRRRTLAAERVTELQARLTAMDSAMRDQPELGHRLNEGPRTELVGMVRGAEDGAKQAAAALTDCRSRLAVAVAAAQRLLAPE
jgi:hypothetical protein